MRRLLIVAALLGTTWLTHAAPAAACSCAAPLEPPPIEVEATVVDAVPADFATLFTFRVDEVVSGDVGEELGVMITEGDGANCGIDLVPEVGNAYRLATYPAEDGGPLHVNACAGSIELLGESSSPPAEDTDDPPPYPLYVVGTLIGVTAVGVALARR